MLELVDPLVPSTTHPLMSEDLQAALGAIQQGAEERLEVLKDKKRKLEMGKLEMKPVLGHIEFEEGDDSSKAEEKETEDGKEGEIPHKRRVTQLIVALKDAKRKENISKQEQRWMELTQGWKGSGASASVGAPTEMTATSTMMSAVSSTMTSTSEN